MSNRKRSKRHHTTNKLKYTGSVEDYLNTIALYCDSKPVYTGTAVFLKSDANIIYDRKLRSLITSGHRFLIVERTSNSISTVLISLLSTSSFMNEELELGIKLYGKYHPTKNVYLDAVNSWIVPVSCIKSVDYRLSNIDHQRCVIKFFNIGFDSTIIKPGVMNNSETDKHVLLIRERMSGVRQLIKHKIDTVTEKDQDRDLNMVLVENYILSLPQEEVDNYVTNIIPKDLYEYLYKELLQNEDYDPKTCATDRSILFTYIWGTDTELYRVLNLMQRGY